MYSLFIQVQTIWARQQINYLIEKLTKTSQLYSVHRNWTIDTGGKTSLIPLHHHDARINHTVHSARKNSDSAQKVATNSQVFRPMMENKSWFLKAWTWQWETTTWPQETTTQQSCRLTATWCAVSPGSEVGWELQLLLPAQPGSYHTRFLALKVVSQGRATAVEGQTHTNEKQKNSNPTEHVKKRMIIHS